MMQAYKLATININRIDSELKIQCLKDYLYAADVDIALLQEVVTEKVTKITGYDAILNIGTEAGTAILYKEGIDCTGANLLDSGRGMSVRLCDLLIVNIYAPSGSVGKQGRSDFFKSDIVDLLLNVRTNILIGGDFNCVLRKEDQEPNFNTCGELAVLVNELRMEDTWAHFHPQVVRFTYATSVSASRLDRIYVGRDYLANVIDCEYWPVNFSNHVAYHVTFRNTKQKTFRGRGTWQLNTSLLLEIELKQAIQDTWTNCLRLQTRYRNRISWWVLYAKPRLRKCVIQYSRDRAYWNKRTSEYYFHCLRELYSSPTPLINHIAEIKRIKAKITALARKSLEGSKIRSRTLDYVTQERTSLFHIVKEIRRGQQKIINRLTDDNDGTVYNDQFAIKRHVETYYTKLYAEQNADLAVGEELLSTLPATVTLDDNREISESITRQELERTIKDAPRRKAAGPDGLPVEFYAWVWDIIGTQMTEVYNELLTDISFPPAFTEGMVVLVPKTTRRQRLNDFRPLTLLNADFKIFTRILNARLKSVLPKIIGPYQTSVPIGRSMLDVLCTYRDLINLTWICKCQLALVFLDFNKAFDRISHEFLLTTMGRLGFDDKVIHIIRNCICGTNSRIKINGQLTGPIPINQSVRQGCPLSMTLFAIAVEPLLRAMHTGLPGITLFNVKTVCQSYADDISVVVNTTEELDDLRRILTKYTSSSGAQLNLQKSRLMHLGPTGSSVDTTWIAETTGRTQLGMYLTPNPNEMVSINWSTKLNVVRGMLRENHVRALDRLQKVQFINAYVLSKIHHIAAVLPIPSDTAHKMLAVACWYVWKRNIFKVSFNTATLERSRGGLGVKHVQTLCQAMFINRTTKLIQANQPGITQCLFKTLRPADCTAPCNVGQINAELDYVRKYFLELSYIPRDQRRTTTKKIYEVLNARRPRNPIEGKHSEKNWESIWSTISNASLPTRVSAVWYDVVNGTIPTAEKLHKIHLRATPLCDKCQLVESVAHLLICGEKIRIWNWTRKKLALMTRTSERTISVAQILFPDWSHYPSAKHNSYACLMGHFVYFVLSHASPTLEDFLYYINCEHSKMRKHPKYKTRFQNFLLIALQ